MSGIWCWQWAGIEARAVARTSPRGLSKLLGLPHNMVAGSQGLTSLVRESQAEAVVSSLISPPKLGKITSAMFYSSE